MENSSVNTFTDGLIMDLNPLMTPKTVLTDVLNGTLLTFNGDELSLQNDAGNTKIKIDDTTYVKLSKKPDINHTPFYPLGIKEYGGVLYIVSGSLPIDNSVLYDENATYNEEDIIRTTFTGEVFYYRSKVNNNKEKLPYDSNEYWEAIGNISSFNNRFGLVEFGSYPSPEFSGITASEGKDILYDSSIPETSKDFLFEKLYTKYIINDTDFKTTRYISFNNTNAVDVDLISGKKINPVTGTGIVDDYKFYKIKLYHQLHNGYLELTDDIWEKYYDFKGVDIKDNFWFNDSNFRYYSQTLYVGKLALELTIEDLDYFELFERKVWFAASNFVLYFVADGKALSDLVQVPKFRLRLWIDGEQFQFPSGDYYEDAPYINVTIPESYDGSLVYYEITPILSVPPYLVTYSDSDLPEEFISKYKILGTIVLNKEVTPKFIHDNNNYICSSVGYKQIVEVALVDQSNNYIDLDLNSVTDPYVFLLQGSSATLPNATVAGEYTITNKVTTMVPDPTISDLIKNSLETTVLEIPVEGTECQSTTLSPYFLAYGRFDNTFQVIDENNGSLYKNLLFPGYQPSSVQYSEYTCIDYNAADKLLFVGGANGDLVIHDISDINNPITSFINICSNDISFVRLLSNGYIAIGEADETTLYLQEYHSNIANYSIGQTTQPYNKVNYGWIKDIALLDGEYYAVTSSGYILWGNSSSNWNIGYHNSSHKYIRMDDTQLNRIIISEAYGNGAYIDKLNKTIGHFSVSRYMRELRSEVDITMVACSNIGSPILRINQDLTTSDETPIGISEATALGKHQDVMYFSAVDDGGLFKILKMTIDPGGNITWDSPIITSQKYSKLFIY